MVENVVQFHHKFCGIIKIYTTRFETQHLYDIGFNIPFTLFQFFFFWISEKHFHKLTIPFLNFYSNSNYFHSRTRAPGKIQLSLLPYILSPTTQYLYKIFYSDCRCNGTKYSYTQLHCIQYTYVILYKLAWRLQLASNLHESILTKSKKEQANKISTFFYCFCTLLSFVC